MKHSLVAFSFLLVQSSSWACMILEPAAKKGEIKAAEIFLRDEVAVLIWDEKEHKQHFIRRMDFKGDAKDFGFVVPLPSVPELAEGSNDLYNKAYSSIYQRNRMYPIGARGLESGGGGASGAKAPPVVEVVKKQEVAGMDAVVLKATDASALQDWLKKNNYKLNEKAKDWVQHYLEKNWYFVAFKFTSKSKEKAAKGELTSPTVRLSFQTDTPFYPYREPEATSKQPDRELNLIVIAPQAVKASFESGKAWKIKQEMSVKYGDEFGLRAELKKFVDSEKKSGPRSVPVWYLTHFRNADLVRSEGEDLVFKMTK